ncbi:GNAT family N-acetyltransferase [Actibacterium pelagium]|uniref:Acetyltransferase n=1 Tax=Actibacterium pelagium TaxID=2029103 RepID=A0A917AGX6_9RHOB|nr:GNAT family N-acetyltransferase [Actibacterium pelagium]GGE52886.1 acetyltransferase [Actibacterium pelagium]
MTLWIGTTHDLEACLDVRRHVFINEQEIPEEEELDDLDGQAIHLLATDKGKPVATARLLFEGQLGKIGRVAVVLSHRGTGLGAEIMYAALDIMDERPEIKIVKLSAQEKVIGFYEKLGFIAQGPTYMDAGIPHRDMYRPADRPKDKKNVRL